MYNPALHPTLTCLNPELNTAGLCKRYLHFTLTRLSKRNSPKFAPDISTAPSPTTWLIRPVLLLVERYEVHVLNLRTDNRPTALRGLAVGPSQHGKRGTLIQFQIAVTKSSHS
jgi:hypothetical protein